MPWLPYLKARWIDLRVPPLTAPANIRHQNTQPNPKLDRLELESNTNFKATGIIQKKRRSQHIPYSKVRWVPYTSTWAFYHTTHMLQPSSSFDGNQVPELFKWCSSFLRGYSVAHQGTEGLAGPGIEPNTLEWRRSGMFYPWTNHVGGNLKQEYKPNWQLNKNEETKYGFILFKMTVLSGGYLPVLYSSNFHQWWISQFAPFINYKWIAQQLFHKSPNSIAENSGKILIFELF